MMLCIADGTTAASPSHTTTPTSAAAVDELEGLFTTAQPGSQATQPQLRAPGPQPWHQNMAASQPGQGMQGMNPAVAMMMMQAGMHPGAAMGFAPGTLMCLIDLI